MMERRRTLDKLHRLGFGKRSASTEVKSSSKTEKLKELTELLKGSRGGSSSTQSSPPCSNIPIPPPLPPPLPPPVPLRNKRKPKSLQHLLKSQQSTDSDHSESISSLPPIDSDPQISISSPALEMHSSGTISPNSIPSPIVGSPDKHTLRPNSSASNLESAQNQLSHELYDSHSSRSTNYLNDDEFLTKLTRPESRQIIGSYTQTTIPFRSASFSQADYNAYKYRQNKDKDKTSLDLEHMKMEGDRKSKVHFDVNDPHHSKVEHVDKGTDTNRYPEKSELNLNLNENGRLSENLPITEVEIATEAIEQCLNSESKRNSDIETILEEGHLNEQDEVTENVKEPLDFKIVKASEVELESLIEEEAPPTPTVKSEEQKASTCVIPIPVYDSVVKEWSTTSPSEQWIQSGETVSNDADKSLQEGKLNNSMSFESKCCDIETDTLSDMCQAPEGKSEEIASIVPELTIESNEANKHDLEITETVPQDSANLDENVVLRNDSQTPEIGHIEVRKRHSNNESVNYQSDSGPNSPLLSPTEEKRRIDKSKRRKGIYIQWPAIENSQEADFDKSSTNEDSTPPWQCNITPEVFESAASELDVTHPDLTKIRIMNEFDKEIKENNESDIPNKNKDLSKSVSDPGTPDLEKQQPTLKENIQRGSLTYQSSDEKDDSLNINNPLKQFKNLFIRGDSMSDNECDRSHDRMSAPHSSHLGDFDLKRYSKRPLRGPYGQMLEAEMKKPSPKVHYEELLEELNRKVESLSPMRGRGISSLSFDESSIPHSHKMKNRKAHTLLPVPSHTRTASSPSQLLEITQRTPSPIPHTRTDSDKHNKKLSLDCHHANLDAKPKRASSDTTDKHSKRSSSSASDKSDKQGRFSSRTPSERSFILHTPETPKGPVPSPELLAELLKGSSEKLTTEQHQQSSRSSNTQSGHHQSSSLGDFGCDLPPAIVKCLVSTHFFQNFNFV
uniref:CSON009087 protein n=1 Tax=Culicoides sonorensis TaxID=179676 RepID=A0A336MX06_CULSO